MDGRYTYCFSNEHWNAGHKEVLFNVHGVVYVADDPENSDPLEKGVKELAEMLSQVKDEQEYIIAREMVHRNTAESTNARVKWWSIFQLGVVGGNGVFQVWYLKRFFEVSDLGYGRRGRWGLMWVYRSRGWFEEVEGAVGKGGWEVLLCIGSFSIQFFKRLDIGTTSGMKNNAIWNMSLMRITELRLW